MDFLIFTPPIAGVILFVKCVSLAKKIKKGDENTTKDTIWGAIMFGYIIFAFIFSNLSNYL